MTSDFDHQFDITNESSADSENDYSNAVISMKIRINEKCKLLLEAMQPEESISSSSSSLKSEKIRHQLRRSPRKSRPRSSYSPIKHNRKARSKLVTPNKESERKRRIIVAETPEEKLIKKQKTEDFINEIIPATPFEKFNKTRKVKERDAKKLTELLQKSEAENKKKRATKRLTFLPSSNGCIENSSTSQNCINVSQTSSSITTTIKQTHSLAALSRVSSTKSLSTLSSFSAPSLRSPSKAPSSNSVSTVSTPTSTVPDHLNAALTLAPDIIQKYKRRLDIVRLTSKKADSNEIFYGRLAGRPNLFNESNEAAKEVAVEKPTTRSATTASQKNRSGRKVEQDFNAVYIAHTLLNAHNETPLMPFKAPKDSPFKVRKLVRHATRADWKKLQKFIAKNNCERSDSSST